MTFLPHKITSKLPFNDPKTSDVEILALDKRLKTSLHNSPFYFFQGIRSGVLNHLRLKHFAHYQHYAGGYESNRLSYIKEFADFISSNCSMTPDLIVKIPTGRPELIDDYVDAIAAVFPKAVNGKNFITRKTGSGSDSGLSFDARVEAISLVQGSMNMAHCKNILIVDDVIDTGSSIAAVIQFLTNILQPEQLHFVVAVPLFIES